MRIGESTSDQVSSSGVQPPESRCPLLDHDKLSLLVCFSDVPQVSRGLSAYSSPLLCFFLSLLSHAWKTQRDRKPRKTTQCSRSSSCSSFSPSPPPRSFLSVRFNLLQMGTAPLLLLLLSLVFIGSLHLRLVSLVQTLSFFFPGCLAGETVRMRVHGFFLSFPQRVVSGG